MTGTRAGLSVRQREYLRRWLAEHGSKITEFHHGDCFGVDVEVAWLVRQTLPDVRIVAHPCDLEQRGFGPTDEVRKIKPPLVRNHDIVDEVDLLLAFPKQTVEQRRGSGTWATIRYAIKVGRTREIVFP